MVFQVDGHPIRNAVSYTSHPEGVALRTGKLVKPVMQIAQHLLMILKLWIRAEPMAATGIDVHRTVIARSAHGRIICHGVGYRRHSFIIVCKKQDCRRSEMPLHMLFIRVFVDKGLVFLSVPAEQIACRASMPRFRVH